MLEMSEMMSEMSEVENADVGNHSCLHLVHTVRTRCDDFGVRVAHAHESHFDVTLAIVFVWCYVRFKLII